MAEPEHTSLRSLLLAAVGDWLGDDVGPAVGDIVVVPAVGPAVFPSVFSAVGPAVDWASGAVVGPAVGGEVGSIVGPTLGPTLGPAVGNDVSALPLDEYEAMKPLPFTEPSALRTTYIVPEVPVTAGGIPAPENTPSSAALALLPSYTFTKSYDASVPNSENLSVTADPASISHEHRMFDA